jgi:hypothetical protein
MAAPIAASVPTRAQMLEQFRRVTAELDPEIGADARWADEPVDYFLHAFRPDGAKLPQLFHGIPRSAGVLGRLGRVFAHAGPETGHMYFVVSRPATFLDDHAVKMIHAWVSTAASMIDVAGLFDETDTPLLHRMVSKPPVEWVAGPPGDGSSHPLLGLIHEAMLHYRDGVEYSDFAELMIEPLYAIACRYDLVHYILRPSLGDVKPADDLFAPAADLWLGGIEYAFVGEGADLRIQAWRTIGGVPVPIAKRAAPRSARPRSGSARSRATPAARPSGSGRKR